MKSRWYYSHDDQTRGPFSEEEIKDHMARRLLMEGDWIWQAGNPRESGVPAAAALDFMQPPKAKPAPDWLLDVALAETSGPAPPLQPSADTPNWLNDLRLWYGLDAVTTIVNPAAPEPPPRVAENTLPNRSTAVPEWLADFVPEAKAIPAAVPAQPGVPSPPPIAAAVATPTPAAVVVPVAIPATFPASPPPSVPLPTPITLLAQKAIEETGFDPSTGQIVDPARFETWKQQKSPSNVRTNALTNASVMEVFRKGRIAIEAWVDDESRSALILGGDIAAIESDSELAAILSEFGKFGPLMLEKLRAHLHFMVENRRKYHAAHNARLH